MAKPVSEEELQLKKRARRRLIGAIALVAAVAAVLPMVLDSEPKPGPQDINIQIPSPEPKGSVVAKVAPRGDKGAPAKGDSKVVESAVAEKPEAKGADKPAEKSGSSPTATPQSTESAAKVAAKLPDNPNDIALSRAPKAVADKAAAKSPEKSAEKPPAKAPEVAPEKTAAKTAAPKAGPGAFFIQVIALSETDRAKQVQQKIADSGVRAYTEVVATGAGNVTRVRAGPFATREEADKAQAKLQGIGLDGKVAAY